MGEGCADSNLDYASGCFCEIYIRSSAQKLQICIYIVTGKIYLSNFFNAKDSNTVVKQAKDTTSKFGHALWHIWATKALLSLPTCNLVSRL